MYDRKDTHRDDIIRSFGSPRRRRSRHGKSRQSHPISNDEENFAVSEDVPRTSAKLSILLFLGLVIILSLLFFL